MNARLIIAQTYAGQTRCLIALTTEEIEAVVELLRAASGTSRTPGARAYRAIADRIERQLVPDDPRDS